MVYRVQLFPQTMAKLKSLMTESGVNYTEKVFESKAGISSLGENLFVSFGCLQVNGPWWSKLLA